MSIIQTEKQVNTVTVSEDYEMVDGVIHRNLTCTCGWEGQTQGIRSFSMGRHHISFTHGLGIVEYMGTKTELGMG